MPGVGIFVDLDAGLDEVSPVGLLGDLQDEALVADRIVVLDLAAVLDGEDVGERAADIGQKGRARPGGGNREAVIEGGQETRRRAARSDCRARRARKRRSAESGGSHDVVKPSLETTQITFSRCALPHLAPSARTKNCSCVTAARD